ncbi:MAG: hypothetical protein OQK50_08070 [Deltaproteobacteria bacterium]|jgi:hypothetical protein|nr:hypothetical protein [Deltaproteobacteria bacterium]MCW9050271.1 hypothetical protein [Deltaproteobacteria bacterium]
MGVKHISGMLLLALGALLFSFSQWQYNQARTPNTCVASFAKSLGGKSTMEFEDSVRKGKLYGTGGMSLGAICFFSGGLVILKSKKKPT